MSNERKRIRTAVKRNHAEDYLLISLVTFAATVIFIRVFLELTGYPQIGNSVLHIAHALWGGLLLIIAAILPLAYANRWAIQVSALLSGVGIGLFIDEVGKFITQTNDYFFPSALSLIYGFFLLTVFGYLYFRRPQPKNPRVAMYHALEGLFESLDGDLDTEEAARIKTYLTIAKQSDRQEIVSLANAIGVYLQQEQQHLPAAKPGYWERIANQMNTLGARLGQRRHHALISIILILWTLFIIGFVTVLFLEVPTLERQVIQWRDILVVIQVLVGGLMIAASAIWLNGNERWGLKLAISGFLLSLVVLQSLYFYLSQFQAITATLLQLILLFILLAYRNRYILDIEEMSD